MIAPPDLNDPAQRAAYRRELQGIARPLRYTGLAFVLLGVVLAVIRHRGVPEMPVIVPLASLALGVLNMLAATAVRFRYHQQRMRG